MRANAMVQFAWGILSDKTPAERVVRLLEDKLCFVCGSHRGNCGHARIHGDGANQLKFSWKG